MAKEEKKAPKLRFNGYTNDWERKKLGILITRVKSYPLSRSVEVKKETDVKYVHYGDIHTNIADEIDKNNNLPFINEIYKEYDELKLDDVIVADASEDYKGIADAAVIISNLPYTIIAGLHTIALRPTSLIKGYFLYHIFKTENFKRFGYKIGTGLKVFGISYNNLAKYKVYYPQEIEEQKKIIGILSNLTNSINLHERKCEELALIKKALLQKLFPKNDEVAPEVRYKNFNDAWEQRKLGEVGKTFTGLSGKTKEDFGHGDAHFVTYMNVYSNPISDPNMVENVEIDTKQQEVKKGDVFFTTSSETPEEVGMSSVWLSDAPHIYLNSFCFGFRPTVNIFHPYYLAYLLRSNNIRNKMMILAQGISRYNISKNKVMKLNVTIPNIREQQKIGEFFKQLDFLITLHHRKLEKLKQLKKFLLQNMFI